jgi:hypothetical protein
MDPEASTTAARAGAGGLRALVARDGRAVLLAFAATVAAGVGVFAAARLAGAPQLQAALAALATTVLWVALAAPVLAASGADALAALLRGGCIADAAAVTLIVLWIACPQVTLLAAVKIYCVLAAMALLGVAASRLARSPAGRSAVALATSAALTVALASPFWVGGALEAAPQEAANQVAAAAVYLNPFYAVTAATAEQSRFVWHQASVLYRITRIGDYAAAPPAHWYPCALVHAGVAVLLAAVAALRHRRRRDAPTAP